MNGALGRRVVAELPVRPEVPSGCDPTVVQREELRLEGIRRERRLDVPPGRADEGHSLALPLDDEPLVDPPRLGERTADRVGRDLVEDHAPDWNLRLEHLEQVPGDRLALAV